MCVKSTILAVLVAIAIPAGAVTYSIGGGAFDPGPSSGEILLVNFDDPLPGGYTLDGDFGVASGTEAGQYEAPANDASAFFYVSPLLASATATIHTIDQSSISFYWGSIDAGNVVEVLGLDGVTVLSISGADILSALEERGSNATSQRIYVLAQDDTFVTGLRFHATGSAFEIDDVAGTYYTDEMPSVVPELATWALMIAGFGCVGVKLRSSRRQGPLATVP